MVMVTTPTHLRVNFGDQLQVIKGSCQGCVVPGRGRRIPAWIGDRVSSFHGFRQPDLKALPGKLNQQSDHVGKITTAALTLHEILSQYAASPDGPRFVLPPSWRTIRKQCPHFYVRFLFPKSLQVVYYGRDGDGKLVGAPQVC